MRCFFGPFCWQIISTALCSARYVCESWRSWHSFHSSPPRKLMAESLLMSRDNHALSGQQWRIEVNKLYSKAVESQLRGRFQRETVKDDGHGRGASVTVQRHTHVIGRRRQLEGRRPWTARQPRRLSRSDSDELWRARGSWCSVV